LCAGLSALHQAVLDDNLGVVRILHSHGADLNLQDADSWTPLHAACANGCADIAK
jgi:ankyrin repeat protein